MKKLFAMFACLLCIPLLCPAVLAAQSDDGIVTASGTFWTLKNNGVLTVDAPIPDYYMEGDVPWYAQTPFITSVVLTRNVTSIGRYAFSDCSNLTSVTIPNSVASIGDSAFYRCSSLTNVTISASVTSIGDESFFGCDNVMDVYYAGTEEQRVLIQVPYYTKLLNAVWHLNWIDYSNLPTLFLPGHLTTIESRAFAGTAAEVIILPESCMTVADDAFDGCLALRYIVNRSPAVLHAPDGVKLIQE